METYVTTKGQMVIPSSVRRKLGIKEGTRIQLEIDEKNRRIILTPITREYVEGMQGRLKGKGLLKVLEAEKQQESDN
jgi:AbrB family looped-hinge helix DNA binding protein